MNYNEYDRYNGGFANPGSLFRGRALGLPGSFRKVIHENSLHDD